MKKATRILLLVSGIMSIVDAVILLITSIVFMVLSSPSLRQYYVDGLRDGSVHSSFTGSPEEVAKAIQAVFLVVGIILLFVTIFAIANAVVSFLARNKESKGLYIMAIVFGVLSGVAVSVVGGIFGLCVLGNNNNPAQLVEENKEESSN